MPSKLLPGLESEFERRLRLDKEQVERARAIPGLIGQQRAQVQEAFGEARRSARSQAARALAAGLTAGGPVTSGAGLAAGRQAGLDQAKLLGDIALQEAREVTGFQREEALAGLEAVQLEAGLTGPAERRQAEINAVEAQIQNIKAAQTGTFTDEGEQAATDIRLLSSQTDDPEVQAYIQRRATEVEAELESTPLSRAFAGIF